MIRWRWLGMGAGGVFLGLACGGIAGSQTSSSSHWIECEIDSECERVVGAVACQEGYCVDESGERIPSDSLGEPAPGAIVDAGPDVTSEDASPDGALIGTGGSGSSGAASSDGGTSAASASEFSACDVDSAMQSCMGSICHGQPGTTPNDQLLGGGLDLFRNDRATWLVDRAATYRGVSDTANCPATPELLVDSQEPNDSLILTKIAGTQSCGSKEPVVGTLSSTDVACITDWVRWMAASAK